MNTEDFLDHILPDIGHRAVIAINGRASRQSFFTDNAAAAAWALRVDATGTNVFHACATYNDGTSRESVNAIAVKSFWLDLDVGDGKPYTSQKLALLATKDFCVRHGIPSPLVVLSGKGLHVYWILAENVRPATWLTTARMLKSLAASSGLHADPARTADIASVLRPVGARNQKHGGTPVRLLTQGVVQDHESFHNLVAAGLASTGGGGHSDDGLGERPLYVLTMVLDNTAMEQVYEGPKPLASAIADDCAIIREFRDTQGNIEEPLWRGCIGVIAHCQDGPELCHEWSSGHKTYNRHETQTKIDAVLEYPPTTRENLSRFRPGACAQCSLSATCKSPVKAGYAAAYRQVAQATPAQIEQAPPAAVAGTPIYVPKNMRLPREAPDNYRWGDISDGGPEKYRLLVTMWKKDAPSTTTSGPKKTVPTSDPQASQPPAQGGTPGNAINTRTSAAPGYTPIDMAISDIFFYPFEKIKRGDNTYILNLRAHLSSGEIKEFPVDTRIIAEGGFALTGLLGANLVTCENNMAVEMQRYLNNYIAKMRDYAGEVSSYSRFGWHEKDFLIGNTLLKADGDETTVLLTGSAATRQKNFIPRGTLEEWCAIVDRAYNHPGVEPLQFAMLAGLASPLLKMFNDYGGVLVYLHSEGTGKGKTTIERAALSAWCSWDSILMTHKQATSTAVYALMGMLAHMPVVIDELTKIPNNEVSDLVHLVSSGTPKERCKQDGALSDNNNRWNTFVIGSGNMLLTEKLAVDRAHAEAEMARIWEYSISPNTPITPSEALELFPKFSHNCGHAGRVFARHIVDNYDDVKAQLYATQQRLVTGLGLAQEERYWTVLLSCVVTTLTIARDLGLVKFPLPPLLSFMKTTLQANRQNMATSVVPMQDLLGQMLGDIWQGMLITQGAGHLLKGQDAYVTQRPHGSVTGRVITPVVGGGGPPEVYVSAAVARSWCNKRNVSAREVFKGAVAAGLLGVREKRFQLGSGSREYVGLGNSIPCWEVLPGAAASLVANAGSLSVLQGGKSRA